MGRENSGKSRAALTSLLLRSTSFIADFDGAHGEDDGYDEEQDAADQPGRNGPALDVIRNVVLELGAYGIRGQGMRVDAEQVGLGRTHVFD